VLGGMLGRLAPQRDEEADAIRVAGMSLDHIYDCDELVAGDTFFVATGVNGGPLPGLRARRAAPA
jgi:fructose-1,6-bisphosphatase II